MPRMITLYHPGLDRTTTCTSRQARVLALSGWRPVDQHPAAPQRDQESEPPQPSGDTPDADADTTEE